MNVTDYLQKKEALRKRFEGRLDSEEYKKAYNSLRARNYREKKKAKADKKAELDATAPAAIPFKDDDLEAFTDSVEKAVIKAYLADIRKTPKQIAAEIGKGISTQHISHILDKPEVKELAKRLIWGDISLACEIAIRDGVSKKDTQWVKLAHEFGYVNKKDGSGCEVCHPATIEMDELTKKSLTALADWLVDKTAEPLVLNK